MPKRTGRHWREHIVPQVLRRDGGICWLCGNPGADSADHIIPASHLTEDQYYNLSNLAAVHHNTGMRCNRKRGDRDPYETRKKLRVHEPTSTWDW